MPPEACRSFARAPRAPRRGARGEALALRFTCVSAQNGRKVLNVARSKLHSTPSPRRGRGSGATPSRMRDGGPGVRGDGRGELMDRSPSPDPRLRRGSTPDQVRGRLSPVWGEVKAGPARARDEAKDYHDAAARLAWIEDCATPTRGAGSSAG